MKPIIQSEIVLFFSSCKLFSSFFIFGGAKFHEDGFRGKYIFIHQLSPYWVVSTSVLFQPKRNSSVISLMSFPILSFPDSFFLSISLNEYWSSVRICYIFKIFAHVFYHFCPLFSIPRFKKNFFFAFYFTEHSNIKYF